MNQMEINKMEKDMKNFIVFILLAVVFAFATVQNNCVIELNSGASLKGELVEENDEFVIIESETLGKMTIQRSNIKDISKIDSSTGYMYNDPNHNTLFIMPSAETNPKGSSYLFKINKFLSWS